MHPTVFADFSLDIDAKGNEVLLQANKEYASDEDKLENFKSIAFILKCYRAHLKDVPVDLLAEDVAWIYRLKHIIARLKDTSVREDMSGREIDDQNYGKLIAALRHERVEKSRQLISPELDMWSRGAYGPLGTVNT